MAIPGIERLHWWLQPHITLFFFLVVNSPPPLPHWFSKHTLWVQQFFFFLLSWPEGNWNYHTSIAARERVVWGQTFKFCICSHYQEATGVVDLAVPFWISFFSIKTITFASHQVTAFDVQRQQGGLISTCFVQGINTFSFGRMRIVCFTL